MSKLNDAMRELRRDEFEVAIREDSAKLSEYRQIKAETKRPIPADADRNETTGY